VELNDVNAWTKLLQPARNYLSKFQAQYLPLHAWEISKLKSHGGGLIRVVRDNVWIMLTCGPSCCNQIPVHAWDISLLFFLHVLPFTSFIIMIIALLIICKKNDELFFSELCSIQNNKIRFIEAFLETSLRN
jgi:hypothetical protein